MHDARGVGGVDASQCEDRQGRLTRQLTKADGAHGASCTRALAGEDRREEHGVNAQPRCAAHRPPGMCCGGFNEPGRPEAHPLQTVFRPVHAARAYGPGERGIARHKKDETAPPARPRQPAACLDPVRGSEMAPYHAKAPRQTLNHTGDIRTARRVSEEEGRRQARSDVPACGACKACGCRQPAADNGLGLRGGHGDDSSNSGG